MRPSVARQGRTLAWDVVAPRRPSRLPGVTMAGFRDQGRAPALVRLVPHPGATLVLDFGPMPMVVGTTDERQHSGSLAAGLGLGGAVWGRSEQLECVQVRLSPTIAAGVLGADLADLQGGPVSLHDLWGRDAARIGEQLHDARSWDDRFALTDALLVRRLTAGRRVDAEVAWAWRRIVISRGRVRIGQLAPEVGWSRRQLWSRFRAQIGLPPKRAANLVRFDHAAHRLVGGEEPARVAADSGYADQSHLHREVRAFTGATPATVAAQPFLAVDDVAWPTRQ